MPVTYAVDPVARIVTVTLSGDVTTADFAEYFSASESDPQFNLAMNRLIVVEHVTAFPDTMEVQRIAERIRGRTTRSSVRFAVVAGAPLGQGMAAMILGHAGMSDRYAVFGDRTSAMRWLIAGGVTQKR